MTARAAERLQDMRCDKFWAVSYRHPAGTPADVTMAESSG
jgi:hypothetical protein